MRKRAGWLDRYSYKESIVILKELALVHARQAGERSQELCRLINNDDWVSLLDYELRYSDSDSADSLYHARQALAFFEKFEPLKLGKGVSKTLAAFHRFAKAELLCKKVNDRFCRYKLGTQMGAPYDVILTYARNKIARILGKAPRLDDLQIGFGPGATEATKKMDSCFRVKLGSPPQCSHELAPFVDRLLGQVPSYTLLHATYIGLDFADVDVDCVFGRLEFVPKDAKKYRTITVEPGLNVLLQQGLGKWIRKRLRKAGIDLSSQERNKLLAQLGSMTGHLATVDFSSASDTIATQMVAFLLPEDWFVLLSLARTRTVTYKGLAIGLEKFSAMGNSFTFELESLIFWAIAWSTLRYLQLPNTELSIYGDDLIIPTEAYSLCELVFAFCGFTINPEKSFHKGPFRESCGGDFFKGIDIRPYYQKDLVTPESLFTLHNFYMRNFDFASALRVRELLHPDLLIFGPDGYGDGHLLGDWTPIRKTVKLRGISNKGKRRVERRRPEELGWEGCFFTSFSHVSPINIRRHKGDPLLPCFSIYTREVDEEQAPVFQKPTQSSRGYMWADPKFLIVPGTRGYEKVSIYTRTTGIFSRWLNNN